MHDDRDAIIYGQGDQPEEQGAAVFSDQPQ